MAVQAQGVTLFVKKESDSEFKEVGCLQSLGDIDFGSRDVIEIECLSSFVTEKLLGAKKFGNMDFTYTFDPQEPNGNKIIYDAFDDDNSVVLDIKIKTVDSTTFEFKGLVPNYKLIDFTKGSVVKVSATFAVKTKPIVTPPAP
ncbi:MAG: hypothetical protein IE878_00400 [Epsilonproteobacteria bacterium]|nr:hypothetical protein [Campylobacterota bacterium]